MVPLGDPQGNEASGSGAPASSGPWSGVYRWKTCDLHTLRSAGLPPGVPRGRQQTRQKDSAVGPHGHGRAGGRQGLNTLHALVPWPWRREEETVPVLLPSPSHGPASQQTPPLSGGTLPAWEAIACLKLIVSSELNPGRMTCHC